MAQKRADMIAATQEKLLKAARETFAQHGFAQSSMDEVAAQVGLTRGALYHHFGDKKGVLQAVISQINNEMTRQLTEILANAPTTWDGFISESIAYINMALEPEIQQIVLLDGPAVLGDPSFWPGQHSCISITQRSVEELMAEGIVCTVDALAIARLINGALLGASLWIANSDDPRAASSKAIEGFLSLVSGLLKAPRTT